MDVRIVLVMTSSFGGWAGERRVDDATTTRAALHASRDGDAYAAVTCAHLHQFCIRYSTTDSIRIG
jgi:hypothetical protein